MDLKYLKDLLKVLRDKGVLEFESNGIKIKLSEDVPESKYKKRQQELEEDEPELTDEELLYYSAIPAGPENEQQQ
jgi:hypothetical protein